MHTSTDLDRCTPTLIDGIPVTDVARTILDVGRLVGDRRLARTIEGARREGQTDWSRLISTLARHARRGRPGVARLRRVIVANAHREEITDSDLELLVIALVVESGLPEPVLHHRIFDGTRFVAEVDLAYPELRIVIELDGKVHLLPEVRERDLPRQNDLVLLGWTVLRFTWARYADRPASVVAEVRAARGSGASREGRLTASAPPHRPLPSLCQPETVSVSRRHKLGGWSRGWSRGRGPGPVAVGGQG